MPHLNNIVDRTLSLLVSQFKGEKPNGDLPNLQKLVRAFALSIQDIENALNDLKTSRNFGEAKGEQLDGIGQILGLNRNEGESDKDFELRLKFKIFLNKGGATPDDIIYIIRYFTDSTVVKYIEYYPAAFQLCVNGVQGLSLPNSNSDDLIELIKQSSPAGVQYAPITTTYGASKPFVFSSDSGVEELYVTDPNDSQNVEKLNLNTGDNLYVNPSKFLGNPEGGGFAEFGTPIDTTGAGQLSEVIMKKH